jgi:hypothetical protein
MESESFSYINLITYTNEPTVEKLVPSSVRYSYIFDLRSKDKISSLFSDLFLNKRHQSFSITLCTGGILDISANENWVEKVSIILCHPLYLKINNRFVICIDGTNNSDQVNRFLETLEEKLNKQGIKGILFIDINNVKKDTEHFVVRDESSLSDFDQWYISSLLKAGSKLNLFLRTADMEFVTNFIDRRDFCEHSLKSNQPSFYLGIKEMQRSNERLHEYEALIATLKESISSKDEYLEFLLGKFKEVDNDVEMGPVMSIKKFYYREYEVLPLWYKQFGHVIKVLMGKRSFRSLFNDKVKNYKE